MLKKTGLMVSVLLFLVSGVMGSAKPRIDSYDFRHANWGMTKLEVMATEELKPVSFTGPNLIYKTVILEREMHLIYEFVDNKLVSTLYSFITFSRHDYREMKNLLIRKYKRPLTERDNGPLDYLFVWETQLTEIVLKPGKGRDCRVEYTGKELKQYIQEKDVLSDRSITDEVIDKF